MVEEGARGPFVCLMGDGRCNFVIIDYAECQMAPAHLCPPRHLIFTPIPAVSMFLCLSSGGPAPLSVAMPMMGGVAPVASAQRLRITDEARDRYCASRSVAMPMMATSQLIPSLDIDRRAACRARDGPR